MYTKLATSSTLLKNIPTFIGVAREAKIFAASMPLTNGIMLQAFRININGQVEEIPVDSQLSVSPGQVVSVSPSGLHIVTSGQRALNRYEIWRYNSATGRYNKQSSGPAYSNGYVITDIGWFNDYVFVGGMSNYDSGNTLGGMMLVTINQGAGSSNPFNPGGSATNRSTKVFISKDRTRAIFAIGEAASPSVRVWAYDSNNQQMILEQTYTPGFAMGDIRNDLIVGTRNGGGADVVKYANSALTSKQANLTTASVTANYVDGDKLMLNNANGSFAFYDLNPTTEQFTSTTTIPKGLGPIVATNRQYRWTRATPDNKLLIAYETNTAAINVFEVKDPNLISGTTSLSQLTTSAIAKVTTTAKINTVLNSFTTQIISGEDQSSTLLNLKFNTAYVETKSQSFGAFSYESFNMQYMHGRTRISKITTDIKLRVDNQIMLSDTVIPSIKTTGITAVPPQFEGDTVISSFTTEGTLRSIDFLTGNTVIPYDFQMLGKISSGEFLEGQTILAGKIDVSGALKTDLGVFVDSIIPPVITEGMVKPDFALFGDAEIDQITIGGFINNPWIIDTDTFIPEIVTDSFFANGEEGVMVATLLNEVMSEIVALVFESPVIQGDVSVPKLVMDGTMKAFEIYQARSAVIIDNLITEGSLEADYSLFGETFLPEFLIDGEVRLSVIADAVMLIPEIVTDALVMLMEGFDVNLTLNSVQTDAILEILKRKRHINIV